MDQGEDVLLDLPKTVAIADGDGLQLDDGRWLRIVAKLELVVEVRHKDLKSADAPRLASGKPASAYRNSNDVLRIRPDQVIEDMLKGFGAALLKVQAPFQPEGGAYGGHHDHDGDGHHHER